MYWFSNKNKSSSRDEALALYKEARALRDYKREYAQYHSKPSRVAERSQRNKARRKLGLEKGDPREVDHKNPISNGGSNARSNLRAVSLQANRKKFTKTASISYRNKELDIDFNKRTRGEQLGLGAAGLGAGAALGIQHIVPYLNIGTQIYSRYFPMDALNQDINITEDQIQRLHKEMSPSTRIPTFDELKSMASDPRNPNRKITDAELDKFLRDNGEYHPYYDTVIAHRNKGGGSRRGHILAHELGHAKLHNKPIIGKIMRAAPVIGSLGISLGAPATVLAGTEEGTLENRVGNVAQYGGIVAAAPRLVDEGYANIEGYRNLKRLGLSAEELAKARKGLATAMSSYLFHAAPTMAAPFLLRKARRKYDERENRKKFTKTATTPHPTYVAQLTNLSSKKQKHLLAKEKKNEQKYGRKDFWKDPRYRAEMEMKHKKLFPSKTSWKQLTDRDFAKITEQYKKCRTDRDKHTAMMQELRKLGLPTDVWREKVRAPAGTWSKLANNPHHLVTGHSGSGKSTLADKLSKELGIPVHALDWDPEMEKVWAYQKDYAKKNKGKLDLSPERMAYEHSVERAAIKRALRKKDPHVIEGSFFLNTDPALYKKHKMYLVNPSKDTIITQRVNRKREKELKRGNAWSPEIEKVQREKSIDLYNMYEPNVQKWRDSSLVEKRASTKHHLITGVPGAGKSTVAKRIAKEKGLPLFEIDSDPRFKKALQLVDEGKIDESNALQRQMFRDAVTRKDPHVIEGAQIMLDPALARQHELQILDDSADVLAPRWSKREAGKHRDRALKSGREPYKDEAYYDKLYRDTVYPRYQKQLEGLRKTADDRERTYGDYVHIKEAKKLTTRARNRISEGNFALPNRRYPIHDITHARNALSMVARHGTASEKAKVRKAVKAKFPSIGK